MRSLIVLLALSAVAGCGELKISSEAVPRQPWTVAGEHGAIFGRQDGTFEAWLWPNKILSHFRISAELENYNVPIDVTALAATVEVTPPETVITYSHAAFTVRQHAFAPRGHDAPATGACVYFEIESVRPIQLTFSFTPEMLPMWPAPQFGRPDGEWKTARGTGFYILHTSDPGFSGLVGMPGTQPGILAPYQERPHTYPLQFRLSFDPKRDAERKYPLLLAMSHGDPSAQLASIEAAVPNLEQQTDAYYAHFFDQRTWTETPDSQFDAALRWAAIAIDQMQVAYGNEIGMVAGYYESADSARPGYAWFFGRDTLWTTYAINSYGDFTLTRTALDFLIHRQRADGKIMHEFSQSAAAIDWKQTPYFYASADSTPLLVMAMWDYVRASGDAAYLKDNWDAVKKAFAFERAHDSDHDGIYENTEGTGWVESWPPGMPHQEIYLAALDQQSCFAMSRLARLMHDSALEQSAADAAAKIARTIPAEYLKDGMYAFSRNPDGSLDRTGSIYPSVAFWQGTYALPEPNRMLSRWATSEFSTDWGTRDISGASEYFDPISYHQGSVWPLFTGWVSLAEYRAGRTLSAYDHLMQNERLTWLQDLGSATELLSGEFYAPLGRSSSHQMWSSAMIIEPALRGLFGLQVDATENTLSIDPHLPARWNHALVHNVRVGDQLADVAFERKGGNWQITATTKAPRVLCVVAGHAAAQPCHSGPAREHTLEVPAPPVEVQLPDEGPKEGDRTHGIKVVGESYSEHAANFEFAAPGGRQCDLFVRLNRPGVRANGHAVQNDVIHLQFPEGAGYQAARLEFSW